MRVLVATDGSTCADVAVDLVASLDWPAGTVIEVIEVIPSGVHVFGGPWPPIPPVDTSEFDDDIREQATRNLQSVADRLEAASRTVETTAAPGRPGDAIVSLAEQSGADVIVVGSRGHGMIETMLLGSVSAEVLDHAHVPVLVARGRSIEHIIFAWDGSEPAETAVPPLTEWGLFSGAHVEVLSVADAGPPEWARGSTTTDAALAGGYHEAAEPSRRQHEELAQQMAERLRSAGLDAAAAIRSGDPAESVVAFAREHQADLVVIGTHGQTGLQRLLKGSVARNVLHHAHCSVMLAR